MAMVIKFRHPHFLDLQLFIPKFLNWIMLCWRICKGRSRCVAMWFIPSRTPECFSSSNASCVEDACTRAVF